MTAKTFSLITKDLLKSLVFLQLFAWSLALILGFLLGEIISTLIIIVLSLIQFVSFLFFIRKSNIVIEEEFVRLENKYFSILTNQKLLFNKKGRKVKGAEK